MKRRQPKEGHIWTCPACGMTLKSESKVREHLRKKHGMDSNL